MSTVLDVLRDTLRWMWTRDSEWLFCVLITITCRMSKQELTAAEDWIRALKDSQ